MQASEKLKAFCFKLATLWSLGEWWLGGIIASLLAIPTLLLLQSLYWLSEFIFYWTIAFGIILFLVIIQWALQYDPTKSPSVIVLDKIVGVMVSLAYVPLRWRVIIFGFLLFHGLNMVQPCALYRKIVRALERLPGVFGVLSADILSGLLVNFFLQLVAWIMG